MQFELRNPMVPFVFSSDVYDSQKSHFDFFGITFHILGRKYPFGGQNLDIQLKFGTLVALMELFNICSVF